MRVRLHGANLARHSLPICVLVLLLSTSLGFATEYTYGDI